MCTSSTAIRRRRQESVNARYLRKRKNKETKAKPRSGSGKKK